MVALELIQLNKLVKLRNLLNFNATIYLLRQKKNITDPLDKLG